MYRCQDASVWKAERMMPSARRWPSSVIAASVSCRNGCQFLMPTYTGAETPWRFSARRSSLACPNVSSFSGERPPIAS